MELQDLPPALLGRTFEFLTLKERCRTIPFINWTFLLIHRMFPAVCQDLYCGLLKRSHAGLLATVAGSMDFLTMDSPKAAILSEVMAATAWRLTLLRRLDISFDVAKRFLPSNLAGLSPLTQITKLVIKDWVLGNAAGLQSFTCLSSLKKLHLPNADYLAEKPCCSAAREFGDLLWSVLAAMQSLKKVEILLGGNSNIVVDSDKDNRGGRVLAAFLSSVTTATKLRQALCRSLRVGIIGKDYTTMVQDQVDIFEGLRTLSQLTTLKMHAFFTKRRGAIGCLAITSLKKLTLFALPSQVLEQFHVGASLLGTTLTCLEVRGGMFGPEGGVKPTMKYDLLRLLPADTPALLYLRELHLVDMALDHFPPEVATALQRLTRLRLSPGNCFNTIPPAIRFMSSLQDLDLSECPLGLDLGASLGALALTPSLRWLYIVQSSTDWWRDYATPIVVEIRKCLPNLTVMF